MNLPAHGTASPDPSMASLLTTKRKQKSNSTGFSPGTAQASLGELSPGRLAV